MEKNNKNVPKPRFSMNTVKRLFNYVKKDNKLKLLIVGICIILNTIATVAGSLYLQTLIDE